MTWQDMLHVTSDKWQVKSYIWHKIIWPDMTWHDMTCDMSRYVTWDMWHVTSDKWNVTSDKLTSDKWLLKRDIWHATCDNWQVTYETLCADGGSWQFFSYFERIWRLYLMVIQVNWRSLRMLLKNPTKMRIKQNTLLTF